jgi:NADPH:quinone reductase-like Zn-dependent oxidoreductase
VTDVAGVVVAVGPGVNGFEPGDKVVAMLNTFVSTLDPVFYIIVMVSLSRQRNRQNLLSGQLFCNA